MWIAALRLLFPAIFSHRYARNLFTKHEVLVISIGTLAASYVCRHQLYPICCFYPLLLEIQFALVRCRMYLLWVYCFFGPNNIIWLFLISVPCYSINYNYHPQTNAWCYLSSKHFCECVQPIFFSLFLTCPHQHRHRSLFVPFGPPKSPRQGG